MEKDPKEDNFEQEISDKVKSYQTGMDSSIPLQLPETIPETFSSFNRFPFFSVIIATFNRKHLLTRALDSLLSQTEKDWEAIIVDDDGRFNYKQFVILYK